MCGITGYIGKRKASDVLLSSLQILEYRGYDSVGIATLNNSKLLIRKDKGKIIDVNKNLNFKQMGGNIGIGHTRWSTHGEPSSENAHPHMDCSGKIAIVHNGIIENFLEIKQKLKGHIFHSDTDSEVIAHLIEHHFRGSLLEAVQQVIQELHGAFALCVVHADKDEIVVVRNGSPLVVGVGSNDQQEQFIASDVSAFVEYTKDVLYLEDGESARITSEGITLFDRNFQVIQKQPKRIDWDVELAQKQGYKHFMLKEINEQPEVVQNSLHLHIPQDFSAYKKVHVVACGTAGHAGIVGKYLIEKLCRIPIEFHAASEFRYKDPLIGEHDLCIAISQSGETADTLAALRLAKHKGAKTLAIINVVESTIAREADEVVYTRAGPEIGVASTKAFLAQLMVFYRIVEKISGKNLGLESIPECIKQLLAQDKMIRAIAEKYFRVYNFLFIGRNLNYPIALEGALKLKEISYIHAEGYASGEMKHGPIALVTDEVPTVAVVPQDSVYSKMVSNIQEVKARKGKIIGVATQGDTIITQHCDDVIFIPAVHEVLYPLLTVIPLQLLSYHIADLRQCDVDKPRNLAKSVTVE
jgi:glutamine---fructose-6-phosphate transaminase (isomerizing)